MSKRKISGLSMLTSTKDLDTFIATDQPETCRHCGTRTDFEQVLDRQLHTCPTCGCIYWLVNGNEEETA